MDNSIYERRTEPARARCLKCQRMFDSRDKRTNRICPKCSNLNYKVYGLRDVRYGRLDGRSAPPPEIE